jgi:hypothetical protein
MLYDSYDRSVLWDWVRLVRDCSDRSVFSIWSRRSVFQEWSDGSVFCACYDWSNKSNCCDQ